MSQGAALLLARQGPASLAAFDDFPGPLYAAGADGLIIYFNRACIGLAGKTPTLGHQKWCVCDKQRTMDGELIEPIDCPTAKALQSRIAIRDVRTIVERSDGQRTPVRAYPTPAIDEAGRLIGLVNVVVPLDGKIHNRLIETANRCKTLRQWICDAQASEALNKMALECERHAEVLRPG